MGLKHTTTMLGEEYFLLTDDSVFEFGMEVKTWAGEKVVRVDVRKRVPGFARKLEVITESGRVFGVAVGDEKARSLVPLACFA